MAWCFMWILPIEKPGDGGSKTKTSTSLDKNIEKQQTKQTKHERDRGTFKYCFHNHSGWYSFPYDFLYRIKANLFSGRKTHGILVMCWCEKLKNLCKPINVSVLSVRQAPPSPSKKWPLPLKSTWKYVVRNLHH